MKNKGFTIVELIVTIAIIALVTVAVGASMTGLMSGQEDREYDSFVKTLENAACTYAEIKGFTTDTNVTVNDLLSYSLIREDLKNPKTKESIVNDRDLVIKVTWENFTKKCTLNVN